LIKNSLKPTFLDIATVLLIGNTPSIPKLKQLYEKKIPRIKTTTHRTSTASTGVAASDEIFNA